MGLAESIVVHVVGWGHLEATGTEFNVHVAVLDDRNYPADHRHDNLMSTEPLVLRILRVDAHRGITHNGLRTCCSHDCIVAASLVHVKYFALFAGRNDWVHICVCHIVAEVEELGLFVTIDDLLGAEHGLCLRIPVDHTEAPVDESLVVEVHENTHHRLAAGVVHCECGTVPVAGRAELLELLEDDSAVLLFPFPGIFEEFLTGEVALPDAHSGKLVDDLCLSCDGCVVGTRHPAGVLAVHTCLTDKDILDGVVEHVAHMEDTSHVRWWYHYRVRLPFIRFRMKELVLEPVGVPFVFGLCRIVLC